jgi:3-hydroxybutyryl-CoA dehydratase
MTIPKSELKTGQALPEMHIKVTQANIDLYARASGDFNPIHIDPEFARQTPAGGTIAHGMLILAYVSQMMTKAFGKNWLTGGHFNVRFKTPARPGDTLTIQGSMEKIQTGTESTVVICTVLCANQNNETVISGEASVNIKAV